MSEKALYKVEIWVAKIFLKLINKKCSPVFHWTFLGWGVLLKACDPWITFCCILQPLF